jgi:LytS/YehU family sensor histidine kinase
MVLQPLVENAIKHGIRDLVDGGVILVRSFVRERWLHALVENPLDEGARPADGDGVGLRNIRQRLARLASRRASPGRATAGGLASRSPCPGACGRQAGR